MRLVIDLVRAADGRLEGVVHTPGAGSTAFDGMLDLLRVLEGIDLCAPGDAGPTERWNDDG
jgi:hypothetical protein